MKLLRAIAAYPPLLLLPVIAVVVRLRVSAGHQLEAFVIGAMATIGGTELVLAGIAVRHSLQRRTIVSRALKGIGAVATGFALNSGAHPLLLASAILLFGVGIGLTDVHRPTATN